MVYPWKPQHGFMTYDRVPFLFQYVILSYTVVHKVAFVRRESHFRLCLSLTLSFRLFLLRVSNFPVLHRLAAALLECVNMRPNGRIEIIRSNRAIGRKSPDAGLLVHDIHESRHLIKRDPL